MRVCVRWKLSKIFEPDALLLDEHPAASALANKLTITQENPFRPTMRLLLSMTCCKPTQGSRPAHGRVNRTLVPYRLGNRLRLLIESVAVAAYSPAKGEVMAKLNRSI
jgi:hypothetical protein